MPEEEMRKKFHEIYITCKNMSFDEYPDLLQDGVSMEEKEFYVMLMEFFMQREQMKTINKGVF